jgi:hypothetical protein
VAASRRAYTIICLLVVAFILYGSLYPFQFHLRAATIGPLGYLWSTRQDWDHKTDLLSNTSGPNDRLFGDTHPVMPAQAGIHDFLCCDKDKSWIPAFAGMTGAQRQ